MSAFPIILMLPGCRRCSRSRAIVSPPDAVAAVAITDRLGVPKRIVTILEGESLVNDATGLTLYRIAVAATVTGAFSIPAATGQFIAVGT